MIWRFAKVAAGGLCLLSLLLCLGMAWLWWHAGRVEADKVEAVAAGINVSVWSRRSGLIVNVVRRWPGPARAWVRSIATHARPEDDGYEFVITPTTPWRWGFWHGDTGSARAALGPDGRVERRPYPSEWSPWAIMAQPLSGPLPCWSAAWVPHWHVVAAAAIPPVLWLGAFGGRSLARRRRARRGLCLGCGYDLTGNVSGRCPECGTVGARAAAGVPGLAGHF